VVRAASRVLRKIDSFATNSKIRIPVNRLRIGRSSNLVCRRHARQQTQPSSSNDAANLGEHLIARDRLHATGPDIVATANRFVSPESLNLFGLGEIKTLDDLLGEQGS
jgi:hypothetical protein